jgi:alanine dehydrogenase
MQIGVPKEVKDHEDRVGLVPSSVAELVHHGHQVIVEKGAGIFGCRICHRRRDIPRRPRSDLFAG